MPEDGLRPRLPQVLVPPVPEPQERDEAPTRHGNPYGKHYGSHHGPVYGPRYGKLVDDAARLYHVSARLLHAVIMTESSYRADAVSPAGAAGLMQLMPQTAARYGVADPFDPAANIAAGARHLGWLLSLFDDDVSLALAAYNAGEGAVLRHGGVPPYPETQRYVARVLELYARMPEPARLGSSPRDE
jgi:soluble lytic murein transglycosylase-like protein